MSISDEIVVMKTGLEQQKGAPQEVYNNPVNKFVAKFLGTPPINLFFGKIENKGLYIGDEKIGDSELGNQEVIIGIRPEGFEVNSEGTGDLSIDIEQVEYIGRDKSIVGFNANSENPTFRFIIDADIANIEPGRKIKATIKKNKCFVFDKITESRIQ
jgi:multiple sugar transport system ATP-binding protein